MSREVVPITPPTGMRRLDAAKHVGVSAGHFDKCVKEGLFPSGREVAGVRIWLRQELDDALFAIQPENSGGGTSCDAAFGLG